MSNIILENKYNLKNNEIRLIGSLASPFVRKVRVALFEKNIKHQFIIENVWKNNDILALNPLGKIPCLLTETNKPIFDSSVIIEYIDTLSKQNSLFPQEQSEKLEVRLWEALCDGILEASILARLELHWDERTQEQRCQKWVDRQLDHVHTAMQSINNRLEAQKFCVGSTITFADFMVIIVLDYVLFRFPEINWKELYPNIVIFCKYFENRKSILDTKPE